MSFSGGSAILALLISVAGFCLSASAADLEYRSQPFWFPSESENLIVADTNADGLSELITVLDGRIRIYFQSEDGFDFESGFDEIELPGQAVGWDVSSAYSKSDSASIIALIDGSEVLVWHIEGHRILDSQTIKSGLPGFLSKGINRLYFSRDINGDGNDDLIIPGAGVLNLFVSDGNKGYQEALAVQSDFRIRTNLNASRLERRTGQAIRIPMMELRDVNNDGFDDLVSRTDERLDVFIADELGERYFPVSPSYSVSITDIEERLGEFDIDSLDFSNLTGVLALTHEEILEDVSGDGIDDLLLREGGKVSLFVGSEGGMDLQNPRQVLRSGGNVLSTFLYDEDEDGLTDLWLWRVEPISVADIFVWLALSGSVSIEAFVYPNDGERFARRPTRKITVELKFPSVIRLVNSVRNIANEAQDRDSGETTATNTANLDADREHEDLLVLVHDQLKIFLNSIEPADDSEEFLGALDYNRQRDNYEINIREILDNVSIGGNPHLDLMENRIADLSIDIGVDATTGDIIPALLNRDALDDIFVFTEYDGSHIRGILLLSK
ncbi:MAG TPA: hypothetical protein DCS89_15875 [Gammaproteobacteria bacterium]|nr:hypothetical protein [Gammaproteobacteria bacterium]HAT28496.1 hypothetical protein [Gammaproteobacteria bacterium]